MKHNSSPFKWRHYPPELILCVRWYCRYQLSARDLEEMMRVRGLEAAHSTVYRWVQCYAPEINKRIRQHLKMSGTSYRVDETYIKVGKTCKYLYRAVDKERQTYIIHALSETRCFCGKTVLQEDDEGKHRRLPFSSSVDKNAAYPEAFSTSQEEQVMP